MKINGMIIGFSSYAKKTYSREFEELLEQGIFNVDLRCGGECGIHTAILKTKK